MRLNSELKGQRILLVEATQCGEGFEMEFMTTVWSSLDFMALVVQVKLLSISWKLNVLPNILD